MPLDPAKRISAEATRLRDAIIDVVAKNEVRDTIEAVRDQLGVPPLDSEDHSSKRKYVTKALQALSPTQLVPIARQFVDQYPGTRDRPTEAEVALVRNSMEWIVARGIQRISETSRRELSEVLSRFRWWGPLDPLEVLPRLDTAPDLQKWCFDGKGIFLWSLLDWGRKSAPVYLSRGQILPSFGLQQWSDKAVRRLLARILSSGVHSDEQANEIVAALQPILARCRLKLARSVDYEGRNFHSVVPLDQQTPDRFIVFASRNRKPDIYLSNVPRQQLSVTPADDDYLHYDRPPPELGSYLRWEDLVNWWATKHESDIEESRNALGLRLLGSLDPGPEKWFFEAYFTRVRPEYGANLPALLPQVWLHWDPRRQSDQRDRPVVFRQRMDFMLLLKNGKSIVVEIDGKQHYSKNGKASPSLYASMVREDRRIRLLGYEVYRFGGAELTPRESPEVVLRFFRGLFAAHEILPTTI